MKAKRVKLILSLLLILGIIGGNIYFVTNKKNNNIVKNEMPKSNDQTNSSDEVKETDNIDESNKDVNDVDNEEKDNSDKESIQVSNNSSNIKNEDSNKNTTSQNNNNSQTSKNNTSKNSSVNNNSTSNKTTTSSNGSNTNATNSNNNQESNQSVVTETTPKEKEICSDSDSGWNVWLSNYKKQNPNSKIFDTQQESISYGEYAATKGYGYWYNSQPSTYNGENCTRSIYMTMLYIPKGLCVDSNNEGNPQFYIPATEKENLLDIITYLKNEGYDCGTKQWR